MNYQRNHTIPLAILDKLERIPNHLPVAMLMRHSIRLPFAPGDDGSLTPITQEGEVLARQLGEVIGERLCRLHVSPLLRCEQTAQALNDGAGKCCPIKHDRLLGEPSVYIYDETLASQTWMRLGNEGVMAHQVQTSLPLPGMVETAPAAHKLLRHMLDVTQQQAGVHVFVTHDSILAPTVAHLLGNPFAKIGWPDFLDAAFFWQDGTKFIGAYQDIMREIDITNFVTKL